MDYQASIVRVLDHYPSVLRSLGRILLFTYGWLWKRFRQLQFNNGRSSCFMGCWTRLFDMRLLLLEQHRSWSINYGSCLWIRFPKHQSCFITSHCLFDLHPCFYLMDILRRLSLLNWWSHLRWKSIFGHHCLGKVNRILMVGLLLRSSLDNCIHYLCSIIHHCCRYLHVVLHRTRRGDVRFSLRCEYLQRNQMGYVVPLWIYCDGIFLDRSYYLHQSHFWIHNLLIRKGWS